MIRAIGVALAEHGSNPSFRCVRLYDEWFGEVGTVQDRCCTQAGFQAFKHLRALVSPLYSIGATLSCKVCERGCYGGVPGNKLR